MSHRKPYAENGKRYPVKHYYVYYHRYGHYIYERTTGTREAADERVAELRKWEGVDHALWTLNHVIKGAFV